MHSKTDRGSVYSKKLILFYSQTPNNRMEGETSITKYKLVVYQDTIYEIPIRVIEQETVLLLSDVQSIFPKATALLSNSKLVPFKLDPVHHTEILPKRAPITDLDSQNTVWEVHVPEESIALSPTIIELNSKMSRLSDKLDRILLLQQDQEEEELEEQQETLEGEEASSSHILEEHQSRHGSIADETAACTIGTDPTSNHEGPSRSNSPPPAFSTRSAATSSSAEVPTPPSSQQHVEAPPSYETSVLSTIKSINTKLRLYESHISNRHKSPKWLAKRQEWISREPNSIEQVAFQLVQLEMALLWTAVTESWIQERETWLTLVASSQSERHLAGAIINLERHTLVMDEEWNQIREGWINDLLEMVVLPLSHGYSFPTTTRE